MSTGREPQRLQPVEAIVCAACGCRVHFATRSSTPSADPRWRIVYLRCPVCGAPATRLVEATSASRRRYVYRPDG